MLHSRMSDLLRCCSNVISVRWVYVRSSRVAATGYPLNSIIIWHLLTTGQQVGVVDITVTSKMVRSGAAPSLIKHSTQHPNVRTL